MKFDAGNFSISKWAKEQQLNYADLDHPVNAEMLWVDLETTGLNAALEVPLEIGLLVTDRFGVLTGDWFHSYLWEHTQYWQEALNRMSEFVAEMHTDLLEDITIDLEKFQNDYRHDLSRDAIQLEMIDFVGDLNLDEKLSFFGSTVGFDRGFCEVHFPLFAKATDYHVGDISSLKLFASKLNPAMLAHESYPKPSKNHRVFDDLASSIREYKWHIDNFLFVSED